MKRLVTLAFLCTSVVACTKSAPIHTTPSTPAPTPTIVVADPVEPSTVEQEHDVLRAELSAARKANLQRLEAYALEGAFPRNREQPGLLNVFQDKEGHLCAVANLINLDGHQGLIASTAATDNFIVLASVTEGPLLEWILDSGFTQEEIGMIQVPYMGEFDGRGEPILDGPKIVDARATEVDRVRAALLAVHKNISENSKFALDVAVERRSKVATVAYAAPQRFAQPPR